VKSPSLPLTAPVPFGTIPPHLQPPRVTPFTAPEALGHLAVTFLFRLPNPIGSVTSSKSIADGLFGSALSSTDLPSSPAWSTVLFHALIAGICEIPGVNFAGFERIALLFFVP